MKTDKKYIKPEMEIIWFSKEDIYTDVISTSVMEGGNFGEDDIP